MAIMTRPVRKRPAGFGEAKPKKKKVKRVRGKSRFTNKETEAKADKGDQSAMWKNRRDIKKTKKKGKA